MTIQRYSIYGSCYDKGEWVRFKDHQQALSALEEQLRLRNLQREASVETERKDCIRALTALSAAGVCTPEETYGTNSSWAIGDLCKALTAAQARITELEKALQNLDDAVMREGIERTEDEGNHRSGEKFIALMDALKQARALSPKEPA
jgi:predicted  nucleic acid-binding Zn-ribbon protein